VPRVCSYNITIAEVACGEEHAVFITRKQSDLGNKLIYSMGSNIDGQLGIGDRTIIQKTSPILIESMVIYKPLHVSCGGGHSAIVMDNGELFTWGLGHQG
jgi:alpha-tubulin suppressor-like RCC1 family protein